MKIKPIGENLLIKEREEEAGKTKGGILVPRQEQDRFTLVAEVIGVGTDVKGVNIGDQIITQKQRCTQFKQDDVELWLIDYKHIIGVIEQE